VAGPVLADGLAALADALTGVMAVKAGEFDVE
jgi:hypothetical protein